jgi:hypothetical protein
LKLVRLGGKGLSSSLYEASKLFICVHGT